MVLVLVLVWRLCFLVLDLYAGLSEMILLTAFSWIRFLYYLTVNINSRTTEHRRQWQRVIITFTKFNWTTCCCLSHYLIRDALAGKLFNTTLLFGLGLVILALALTLALVLVLVWLVWSWSWFWSYDLILVLFTSLQLGLWVQKFPEISRGKFPEISRGKFPEIYSNLSGNFRKFVK